MNHVRMRSQTLQASDTLLVSLPGLNTVETNLVHGIKDQFGH